MEYRRKFLAFWKMEVSDIVDVFIQFYVSVITASVKDLAMSGSHLRVSASAINLPQHAKFYLMILNKLIFHSDLSFLHINRAFE